MRKIVDGLIVALFCAAAIPAACVLLVVLVLWVVTVPLRGCFATWRNRRRRRRGGLPWVRLRGGQLPASWPEANIPLADVQVRRCDRALTRLRGGPGELEVVQTVALASDLLQGLREVAGLAAIDGAIDRVVTWAYTDDATPEGQ